MSAKPFALVIGGSRGIGRSTALRLAKSGFDIFLTYHSNEVAAKSTADEIAKFGVSCQIAGFDVADGVQVTKALGKIVDEPHL